LDKLLEEMRVADQWSLSKKRDQVQRFCLHVRPALVVPSLADLKFGIVCHLRCLLRNKEIDLQPHNAKEELNKKKDSLLRWFHAYNRGEYEPWGGLNDLSLPNCKVTPILQHVDKLLETKFPLCAKYNELNKSETKHLAWGVLAREFTPAGTVLGYVLGESMDSMEAEKRIKEDNNDEHLFMMKQKRFFVVEHDHFIDLSPIDSCYARYYKFATKKSNNIIQNVSVERSLSIDNNTSRRTVGFITNRAVQKGEEFVVAFDSVHFMSEEDKARCSSEIFVKVCEAIAFDMQHR
jgi:hypothetical protein